MSRDTVKHTLLVAMIRKDHFQRSRWFVQLPMVVEVHVHERRDVKILAEAKPKSIGRPDPIALPEHVTAPLAPGRITYFGHDGLDIFTVSIETVVQVQRTEVVTIPSELCEQSDGSLRPVPSLFRHQLANGVGQWRSGVAQVVVSAERSGRKAQAVKEQTTTQQPRQFVKVQVNET